MTLALLFPGQGSQYEGMADPWLSHPAGRSVMEEASATLGRDVPEGCRDPAALATTGFVQPALLACDVAAFRVLEAGGVTAGAAAGHSLGEIAALVAAGAMGLGDALEVVQIRGAAMQDASDRRPGAMTAVIGLDAEDAAAVCEAARGEDVLEVANENAGNQFVLSGSVEAVARAEALAKELGGRAIRLKVAGAFHSPLMEPAVPAIREALERTELRPPRFPVAANVSGDLEDDPERIRELLTRHVVSPVRWDRATRVLADNGCSVFVEAGPGQVLTRLAKRALPQIDARAVGSPADADTLARSGAELGS